MEMIGIQRARGRDLATGIVLGAGFGLAALFLYLGTTYNSTTGATVTILFGSIFALSSSTLPLVLALGAVTAAIIALHLPPAAAELGQPGAGRRARAAGAARSAALYLLAMALAVALSAVTIGAILSTALLIGPGRHRASADDAGPAARSPPPRLIGVAAMWLGILLAYDSYYWPPHHHGWPVSFFVVTLVLIAYIARPRCAARRRRRS